MAAPPDGDHAAQLVQWDPGGDIHGVLDDMGAFCDVFIEYLCNATAMQKSDICKGFLSTGDLYSEEGQFLLHVDSILQDTGAHGSSFVASSLVDRIFDQVAVRPLPQGRMVRLGDKSIVPITHEVSFILTVMDPKGVSYTNPINCSIINNLSHGIIIGLIDLLGPFYPLFDATVSCVRALLNQNYKKSICDQKSVKFNLNNEPGDQVSQANNNPKQLLINNIGTGEYLDPYGNRIFYPWSKLDEVAPEELETPDLVSFPEDVLMYLTTSHEEVVSEYLEDLKSHISADAYANCSKINGECRYK
jgi:hypothetical protein